MKQTSLLAKLNIKHLYSEYVKSKIKFYHFMLNSAEIHNIRGHWIFVQDLNSNSIVIDLGANKGGFSKLIQEKFKSKCYAIEANKNLFDKIKTEIPLAFNYAISSFDGPLEFYISKNDEASSIIRDFENEWGFETKIQVEGVTFKNLLKKLELKNKEIEIVKVDIEGAELNFIESLTIEDVKNVKQISIEFHDWLNKSLHERTINAIKKLESLGFTSYGDYNIELLFINKKLVNLDSKKRINLGLYKMLISLNNQLSKFKGVKHIS